MPSPPRHTALTPVLLLRPAPFLSVSYDKHVTPNERVTDFRTFVSGVKANHLKGGLRLRQCQEEVAAILKDRVLVGHALSNDLKVRIVNYHAFSSSHQFCSCVKTVVATWGWVDI